MLACQYSHTKAGVETFNPLFHDQSYSFNMLPIDWFDQKIKPRYGKLMFTTRIQSRKKVFNTIQKNIFTVLDPK